MLRLSILLLLGACGSVDQHGVETVAAIEVPVRDRQDSAALLALLRRHAAVSGLHVDDGSAERRQFEAQANQLPPSDRVTFNVGVWRGKNDDENEAIADDRFHHGKIWITFPRGSKPEQSSRFRDPLIAEIMQRWPDAKPIPILPWGGLPHARDLISTASGYRIRRSAAADYKLSPSLPIFASD